MEDDVEDPPPSSPKRRSAKMESDSEEVGSQLWREQQRPSSSPPKKKKRGPGRPRKPDHELARPRRPSTATRIQPKPRTEELKDAVPKFIISNERTIRRNPFNDATPRKRGTALTRPTEDQGGIVTIAAQQQQIESMQEKLRQYEAHIKAMEARHGSTPPTPAMSIIQSSSHSHAHPINPQNTPMLPSRNAHEHDQQMEREDSPLSVYSDLWTEDLESTPSNANPHKNRTGNYDGFPTSWNRSDHADNGKEKEKAETLIIKLKANPVIRYSRAPLLNPLNPAAQVQEWEYVAQVSTKRGVDENEKGDKGEGIGFPGGWFRSGMRCIQKAD